MKKYSFIFILTFLIFAMPAYSAGKVTIAILDLTSKGVPRIVSNAISDIIRSEFVNIGNFTVVERSQMNAILDEQGLQMTGCTDSSCAVQFGKLLSARRIVIGEVNKVGSSIVITARYVNVESGESLFSSSGKASSIDEVDTAAKSVANDLAQRIVSGDKEVIVPVTKKGYYGRGAVPGWGQFYAGDSTKGYTFAGAFAVSILFSAYMYYNNSSKKTAYENQDPPQSKIDAKYDDWQKAYDMMRYSFVLVGVVYVINWIDVLLFSAPDFSVSKSAENQTPGNTFYCLDVFNSGRSHHETNFIFKMGMRF